MSDERHETRVRRQFGASAEGYRTSASHARGRSLTRLVERLRPQPHWRVLDVATGAGHAAATLAPHVDLVVAGDTTREMLEQAGVVRRERGIENMLLVRESAQALAYPERTFDLVVCRVAAHHFADPDAFVAESARVLKPGGLLAVIDNIVPAGDAGRWINEFETRRDPSHARCLDLEHWRRLFAGRGLEMEYEETSAKWFDFEDWMRRMNVQDEPMNELADALLTAPEGVREFWQPVRQAGGIKLALQEAMLIGRLPA